ncbi:MAG: DUF362 domain-containing protein [Gammaproteobacteria bacterium]|nr:DUF362 domain-containing protein [Gammaproteobacteria bacterium]
MLRLLEHHSYNREAIKALLETALADTPLLRGGPRQTPSVLLKPNFVMPAPRSDASTTHPELYMAIAELLLARGFRVGIGESPAFGSCARALAAHGVLEECLALGISVVEFRQPRAHAGVEDDRRFRRLTVAAELGQWDTIVNLPKVKTHQQFTFTGATKNLYGCVVGKRKFIRHNLCGNDPVRFARMIIATAAQTACSLHIGDGIEAMHVRGPRGGQSYPLGRLIVADDNLEHDWLLCRLIGLAPEDTPLFRALDQGERDALRATTESITTAEGFQAARDFRHAPLVHISFSPWAIARSGYRTIRYRLQGH